MGQKRRVARCVWPVVRRTWVGEQITKEKLGVFSLSLAYIYWPSNYTVFSNDNYLTFIYVS